MTLSVSNARGSDPKLIRACVPASPFTLDKAHPAPDCLLHTRAPFDGVNVAGAGRGAFDDLCWGKEPRRPLSGKAAATADMSGPPSPLADVTANFARCSTDRMRLMGVRAFKRAP
jgi:hypothetical protein